MLLSENCEVSGSTSGSGIALRSSPALEMSVSDLSLSLSRWYGCPAYHLADW